MHIFPFYFLCSTSVLHNYQIPSKLVDETFIRDYNVSFMWVSSKYQHTINHLFFQCENDIRNDLPKVYFFLVGACVRISER
jgi:hypothetical protein